MLLLCPASERRREGHIWGGEFEKNTLRVVVLGVLCDFLISISSFAYLQPR
jgi:hypothetical protein